MGVLRYERQCDSASLGSKRSKSDDDDDWWCRCLRRVFSSTIHTAICSIVAEVMIVIVGH